MKTPVMVAVYIDRIEAILAGRNKWNWQKTAIDLDVLDSRLRKALSVCKEINGTLHLTHANYTVEEGFLGAHEGHRFQVEREGPESILDPTPETALRILENLASIPDRMIARGKEMRSELQERIDRRVSDAMTQANTFLAETDKWLSTPPDQLVIEHTPLGTDPSRFEAKARPASPFLTETSDLQIEFDGEDVRRMLAGDTPQHPSCRLMDDHIVRKTDNRGFPLPTPIHLQEPLRTLELGMKARAERIVLHEDAIEKARHVRWKTHCDVLAAEEEMLRRAAETKTHQATEAREEIRSNQALRDWANANAKMEIIALLDGEGATDQVANTVRTLIFTPFNNFKQFRKIRKQDLLIANPNLRIDVQGLETAFEETVETSLKEAAAQHRQVFHSLLLTSLDIMAPIQFTIRHHRARLTRRGETVGTKVEARSALCTISFGDLKFSRAFAIGPLSPI